jgi:quercetin dioxygenase-like cupin family protein
MYISDHRTSTQQGDTQYFTGEVWMDELAAPGEHTRLGMLRVHFAPGAHTNWHKHPCGQILHVIGGVGLIQARGGEIRTLSPGDTAITPAEEWHWHGAATDTMMTMISVQGADAGGEVVHWGPAVDSEAGA